MKNFVSDLAESGLAVSTQSDIVVVVKQIIASAVNEEGEFLYPRTWNSGYIDAPQVVLADRRTPAATAEQIEAAAKEPFGAFWGFLGGTGLRISEARATRYGDDGIHTAWDPDRALVTVRTQINRGLEQSPKTPAAVREVDLPPNLNDYLKAQFHRKPREFRVSGFGDQMDPSAKRNGHPGLPRLSPISDNPPSRHGRPGGHPTLLGGSYAGKCD